MGLYVYRGRFRTDRARISDARLILTGVSPGDTNCTVTGTLDGSSLSYVLISLGGKYSGQFAGYSDALDGSTPITVTCAQGDTLIGYLVPLS